MTNKDKFFFFGFGQTAKYLVNNLKLSNKKFLWTRTGSANNDVSASESE